MITHLAWALIHFLWQGTAIAAIYLMIHTGVSRATPQHRYVLAVISLAAMLAAPIATLLLTSRIPVTSSSTTQHIPPGQLSVYGSELYSNVMNPEAANPPDRWLLWIVLLWLAGTLAFSLRLLTAWALTLRLRTVSTRPAPSEWQQKLDDLRRRIHLSRPAQLLTSALVEVPGVIGHLRPVILVPVGLLTGLPPDHVEALLLHELAHIRRHDYLVNILQGLAEALLFYHPAVWWISHQIRAQREHCCDDIAVAATGDTLIYIRALAEFASSRAALPTPALSATGGSLTARIARLTGQPHRPARRNAGSFAIPATFLLIGAALAIHAQTPDRPQFEVASIKEDINYTGKMNGMGSPSPGTFRARDIPLRWLIRGAYNINSFNIFGGPKWLDSAAFDIDAKTPVVPGETRREETARMNVMLQTLLEDRMKLKLHVEQREMPVYILTVSKKGLKMKHAPCDPREPACQPQLAEARKTWLQPINGNWATIPDFLVGLATMTGGQRVIVDRTALTGVWDTHMQFHYVPPPKPGPNPDGGEPPEPGDSIFTALEEQLGLHLEAARAPVDVIVIDSAEKPDPN